MNFDNQDRSRKISVVFDSEEINTPEVSWNDGLKQEPSTKSFKTLKEDIGTSFGFQMLKTGYNIVSSRVGAYTGNYMAVNQLNAFQDIALGISVIASGNPIAITAYTLGQALKVTDYFQAISTGNLEANMIASITSTSASNRSRGRGGKI